MTMANYAECADSDYAAPLSLQLFAGSHHNERVQYDLGQEVSTDEQAPNYDMATDDFASANYALATASSAVYADPHAARSSRSKQTFFNPSRTTQAEQPAKYPGYPYE